MDPQPALPYRERVDAFRRRHRTGLVTLLFTDIVGSTALKQQLGDRAGAELFLKHRQLVRATLREFPQGEEIETAGDSFLIIFATPSDAVQFALLLQARLGKLNQESGAALQDRIGIHVGEVVIGADEQSQKPRDLFGIQIDTCSRVMSLAKAGQTLMTRSVFDSARQVLKGEDIEGVGPLEWLNHGPYLLKGIEESVEVCEVGEVGISPLKAPAGSEKAQRQVSPDSEPVLGWRPALGQVVPHTKWLLEQKLGEGGFGEVWLGRHQTMKERRVFKFCFRADRVRSLKREMTLFRILKERVGDHPNIVRLLEVYFEEPPFYVVMDYVEGQDLKAWCEGQGGVEKVPLAVRLEIVPQIADALQAAHDAGVIHRDVKPGNILISGTVAAPVKARAGLSSESMTTLPNDSPPAASQPQLQVLAKLTDFGIGQVVSEEALKGVTKAGFTETLVASSSSSQTGSQMYMAPELLAGKPASTRSDIYSLGVVLYQLLVEDLTRPLTTDWADHIADPLLRDDLKHCFAGNPQDRFAGASQLAKNLRALPERQAQLARQQAEAARRERAAYRRGIIRTTGFAALIVVAVSALALFAFRQAKKATKAARELRRNLYVADMKVAHLELNGGNRGVAVELVNKYLHPAGEEDLRGFEWRYLWKLGQGREQFTLAGHSTNRVRALAFGRDGKTLFSGGFDNTIKVWDLASRKQLLAIPFNVGLIRRIAVSPTSGMLIIGGLDGVVVRDGPSFGNERRLPGALGGLALSPDGRTLVTDGTNGIIVWDTSNWEKLRTLANSRASYTWRDRFDATAFSADGTTLALGVMEGQKLEVKLWNVASLRTAGGADQPVCVLQRGASATNAVVYLALSNDGRRLATASHRSLQLWDAQTGGLFASAPIGPHRATGMEFLSDGRTLVTSSYEQDLEVWDVSTGTNITHVASIPAHGNEVSSLATALDGKTLASGCKDGTIKVWAAGVFMEWPGAGDRIQDAGIKQSGFAEQGRLLVTLTGRGALNFWDTQTLAKSDSQAVRSDILTSAFSPDGTQLAVVLTNGAVQLWTVSLKRQTPMHVQELLPPQPSHLQSRLTWSPDGRCLAAFVGDVSVWNTATPRLINRLSINRLTYLGRAVTLALSPGGRILAAAVVPEDAHDFGQTLADSTPAYNSMVELWDVASGRKLSTCLGHTEWTGDLAFSPDGKVLASSNSDNTAKLWHVPSGKLKADLTSHTLAVFGVAFSPDGRTLVTIGGDASKLWNVETGQELMTLAQTGILPVFSSDGRVLALEALDEGRTPFELDTEGQTIRFWRAPSLAEIEAAEAAKARGP